MAVMPAPTTAEPIAVATAGATDVTMPAPISDPAIDAPIAVAAALNP